MLKLVKDFEDYKIIYYWIDAEKVSVSPFFPTLSHAKEWYIHYHFNQYQGPDRRKRKVDRRSVAKNDFEHVGSSKRSASRHGRRLTDQPIQVDIDLAKEKLSAMVQNSSVRLAKTV